MLVSPLTREGAFGSDNEHYVAFGRFVAGIVDVARDFGIIFGTGS